MDLHLPLVLATPPLLGLAAAVAALLWPRRSVLWPFLLPMWAIAANFHGLLACRDEITGLARVWFRLDVPGIWLAMTSGPLAAIVLWWHRHSPTVAALRARPWRLGLVYAAVATIGMLPLPGVPGTAFACGGLAFRSPTARAATVAVTLGALAAWPLAGPADALAAAAGLTFAAALRNDAPGQRAWQGLALVQALLAGLRATGAV